MLDRLNELIEEYLVGLGLTLSRLSSEETKMITLFLASLLVAAAAACVLHMARL
jgi:hypothetical protein